MKEVPLRPSRTTRPVLTARAYRSGHRNNPPHLERSRKDVPHAWARTAAPRGHSYEIGQARHTGPPKVLPWSIFS